MKYLKHSLICLAFLTFVSCNENGGDKEAIPSIQVDFLINNDDLESLGFDYSPNDLNLYKNDPDKVFFAQVGEQIEFKDISAADIPTNKTWLLDGEEWKANEINTGDFPSFKYTFDVAGLYKVSLSMGDMHVATKYVRVLDRSGVDIINSPKVLSRNEGDLSSDGLVEEDLKKESKGESKSTGVHFDASSDKLVQGQSVTFTDNTELGEEIEIRVWDFGDGTVMPTKGNRVKYNYILPGTYEVKLCLNYSDLCTSKKITVNHKPKDELEKSVVSKNKQAGENKESINQDNFFRSISFDSPSKTKVGIPVRCTDKSSPISSVWKRDWFINGEKQNYSHQFVDMVFDRAGEYVIKMCLNNQRANCIEKRIKVFESGAVPESEIALAESPKKKVDSASEGEKSSRSEGKISEPKQTPPLVLNPIRDEFICRSYSKAGFKAKYRCLKDKAWYEGTATIKVQPKTNLELLNTIVYGSEVGLVDVLVLSTDNRILGRLENVQVLPGHTSIELSEMGLTLLKGKSYYLVIVPLERKGKYVTFESAVACKQFYKEEDHVSLDFLQDAFILFDIKYCY